MLPEREEVAKLVICEDDRATLDLLCDHLLADRYGVLAAPTAAETLAQAHRILAVKRAPHHALFG